jgi:hypothetical protein
MSIQDDLISMQSGMIKEGEDRGTVLLENHVCHAFS